MDAGGEVAHVVDGVARELERHAQFDDRLHFALTRAHAFERRLDAVLVARADGGECGAARALDVHDAAARKGALEGARDFFFDLRPRGRGNRRQLAMEVIHTGVLL